MDFLSAPFFATQAALLVVYWMVHGAEWRNRVLLAGSLFFLFTLGWQTAAVLIVSALLEWRIAIKLGAAPDAAARKRWLWTSLALNLSQLAFFKYGRSILPPLQDALAALHLDARTLSILMPVGISFWTLQKMTLTLEVYFKKRAAETDPVRALLFTAFFPTVLSGPIEPARNLLPQLAKDRRFDSRKIAEAAWLFALGAFFKAVIADNVGAIAEGLLAPGQTGAAVVIGGWAYMFQLFGDFAGYSYMARGLARLYGLDVTQNFGAPYLARNLSDFWKQWHVSLTNWLNEYVFATVSMRMRNYGTYGIVLAIWATFLVSGLWHGTGWLFVFYGALHAIGVTIFTLSKDWRKRMASRFGKDGWLAWAAALLTFHYVCLTFLVFRSHDFASAWAQLAAVFRGGWNPFALNVDWPTLALSAASVFWLQRQVQAKRDVFWIFARPVWFRVAFYLILGFLLTRFFAPADRFIYFQF